MTNSFYNLWKSTKSFHERFDLFPPKETSAIAAYSEESEELREAFLEPFCNDEDIKHEAADVIVTIAGMLMSRGIEYNEFIEEIHKVIEKNDKKTYKTHYINSNGKIQRNGRE